MLEKKESDLLPVNNQINLENILLDFYCSLLERDSKKGRLCLNEQGILFSSENKETDFFLNFSEIKKIQLNGENIEVETKKENKINFSSFEDFNSAFEKINNIFNIYLENTEVKEEKNSLLDSGDNNNDNEESNKRFPSSKFSTNSNSHATIDTSFSSSNNTISLKEKNKEKKLKENLSAENINKLLLDEEKSEEKKLIRNKSSPAFKINKSIDSFESEKIIFREMNPDLDYEICKKIINIPPKDLFEKYHTKNNPETSYEAFFKWVGEYSKINIGNWEKIESEETQEKNDIVKYKKKEMFSLALHGVPIINKTDVERTCIYWIDKDGTYYLDCSSKSKGVPLSDKFTLDSFSEFHPYMNNTKTVFRTFVRTTILGWTLFKSALIYQGKRNYNKEITEWMKFITEKGEEIEGDYFI